MFFKLVTKKPNSWVKNSPQGVSVKHQRLDFFKDILYLFFYFYHLSRFDSADEPDYIVTVEYSCC